MAKSIHRHQSELLLSKMQANPDIARGFIKAKEKKGIVSLFWKKLEKELNSVGPPVKTIFEWKKVWTDQKRYVRKKAASNKQHQRGTGGGPNRQWKLSPAEETIFQLIGMQEAVGGIDGGESFGIISCANRSNSPEKENEDPSAGDYYDVMECISEEALEEEADFEMLPTNSSQKNKKQKMTTSEIVEKELQVQEKLCASVVEAIDLLKSHVKEMQYCSKKIYRSLGDLNATKKSQLEEMKRHNSVMENLRTVEIESQIALNNKIMEKEEMYIKQKT